MMGNRYASEAGGLGGMPQQGGGGMPLLGQRQPSLAHAAQLAQKRPNPVTQIQPTQIPLADASGIQQAAQMANAKTAGEAQGNAVRAAITALMMRSKCASALTEGGLSRPQSRNLGLNSTPEATGPKIVGTPFGIGSKKPVAKPVLGAKAAGDGRGDDREMESGGSGGQGEKCGEAAIQALFHVPSALSRPETTRSIFVKRALSGQLPPPGPGSNAGNSALPPPGPPPMPGPGQAVPPQGGPPQGGPPPGMPPGGDPSMGAPPPGMDPSMGGMPPGPPPQPGVPPMPGTPPPGQPVPGTSPPDPPPPPMQHRRQNIRSGLDRLLNMKNRRLETAPAMADDMKHEQMALGKMASIDVDINGSKLDISGKPGMAMLLAGLGGGMTGGQFGGIAGLGHGHAKGNALLGGLRGVGRGAMTGGGAGVGAVAGNLIGDALGGETGSAWGGLAGAGLGGLAGWSGASRLMGPGKKKDKRAGDSETGFYKSALGIKPKAQPHAPLPVGIGAMSPSPAIGGPPPAGPESGALSKQANAWMKALRPVMGGLAGGMVGAGVADGSGGNSMQGFMSGAALGAGAGGLSMLGRGAKAMAKNAPRWPASMPPVPPAAPQASMVPTAKLLGANAPTGPMPIPMQQGPRASQTLMMPHPERQAQGLMGQKAKMRMDLGSMSPADAANQARQKLLAMGHTPEQAEYGAKRLFHHMTEGKFSGGAGAKAPSSMPSAGQPKGPAPLSQFEISHDAPSMLPLAATAPGGRLSSTAVPKPQAPAGSDVRQPGWDKPAPPMPGPLAENLPAHVVASRQRFKDLRAAGYNEHDAARRAIAHGKQMRANAAGDHLGPQKPGIPNMHSSSDPHPNNGWGNTTHTGMGRVSPTQQPPATLPGSQAGQAQPALNTNEHLNKWVAEFKAKHGAKHPKVNEVTPEQWIYNYRHGPSSPLPRQQLVPNTQEHFNHYLDYRRAANPAAVGKMSPEQLVREYRASLAQGTKTGTDWLSKLAAQDNSKSQRSSTGESEGLSYQHKPDHYMQGQDAWASVNGYFKGSKYQKATPNPFEGRHSGEKKAFLGTAAAAGVGGGAGWGIGKLLGGDEGGARGAAIGSGAGAGGAAATMLPMLAALISPKLRAGFGKAVGGSAKGLWDAAKGLKPLQAAKGAYNVASDAVGHSFSDPTMKRLTMGSMGLGAAGGGLAGEMAYQGAKQGWDAFLSEGEALASMVRRA